MTTFHSLEPCTLLPVHAREKLIKASEIKDDRERAKAIDDVTKRIKANHPQYFRKEKENEIID